MNEGSGCFTFLSAFGADSAPGLRPCSIYAVVSHYGLICIFPLMTYDLEHLFIFHLHILFGEVSTKVFGLFFNQVVCFLNFEF